MADSYWIPAEGGGLVKHSADGWLAKIEYGPEMLEIMTGPWPTREDAQNSPKKAIELIMGVSDG